MMRFVHAHLNYYIGEIADVATHAGGVSVYYTYALIASGEHWVELWERASNLTRRRHVHEQSLT